MSVLLLLAPRHRYRPQPGHADGQSFQPPHTHGAGAGGGCCSRWASACTAGSLSLTKRPRCNRGAMWASVGASPLDRWAAPGQQWERQRPRQRPLLPRPPRHQGPALGLLLPAAPVQQLLLVRAAQQGQQPGAPPAQLPAAAAPQRARQQAAVELPPVPPAPQQALVQRPWAPAAGLQQLAEVAQAPGRPGQPRRQWREATGPPLQLPAAAPAPYLTAPSGWRGPGWLPALKLPVPGPRRAAAATAQSAVPGHTAAAEAPNPPGWEAAAAGNARSAREFARSSAPGLGSCAVS